MSYKLSHILGIFDAYHKATCRRAIHFQPLMNPADPALTICARGLSRRFGTHVAVHAIDLDVRRGEVLGLLGPNGAGKTTTMQMLTGNLAPSAGEIRICNIDLLANPVQAKTHIGYLPETPPLYRELQVGEYLHLVARLHRLPRAQRSTAVIQAMQRCGLAAVGRKLIGSLSKGYQQRVGIAQAIVHEPDVIILDEPTVGLDPNQILDIRALIRELGDKHCVILSTHILPEVEAVCDRVQIMHHGAMVLSNTIAGLRDLQQGRTMTIGLQRPPPIEKLQAIAGIAAVESAENGKFRIRFSPDMDPTPALISRAAAEDWGLNQLAPAQTSLEDVFVQLTRDKAAP
jgi:ABC-2 type transport system ATP-binding protein